MHAGMRRVPAERARHAKRLGHAQILARPDNETTTTTQQSTTTSAPSQAPPTVVHPSSSALTSPSSSPTLSSSTATPSTSSSIISTKTEFLTISAPSSSSIIPTAALTSTFPTSSSTSTPHPVAAASRGLSSGAIAGIIAGAVVVGAALVVFAVRKTYLRRRERKHVSWDGAPGLGAGTPNEPKPFPDTSEPDSFTSAASSPKKIPPLSPFQGYSQSMYATPLSPAHMQPSTYTGPSPPPATYNNPISVAPYPKLLAPLAYGPGNLGTHPMAGTGAPSIPSSTRAPMEAMVKCTFVPNLPDELSIVTDERVFIIEQYDDGWDLCTNTRGERGMVPRECLEYVPINQPDIGWRNARRTSSLNPDGKTF